MFEEGFQVLVRSHEETGNYGGNPWKRSMEELLELGLVVVDKPPGPTSHQVTAWVKQLLGARKAGHSGTLDPGVTGVLPVALNSATKVIPALLHAGKEYVGVMRLHGDVDEARLREVASSFEGVIVQTPPAKSAVKRRPRERRVYFFEILEVDGRDVLFRTAVQAGTYIRKLCHDMGVQLKVGANMRELRRTRAGPFTHPHTMQELSEAWNYYRETGDETLLRRIVRPVEDAIIMLPKVYIKDSAVASLTYGANLGVNGVAKLEGTVRQGRKVAVLTLKGELVAIGTALMDAEEMLRDWEREAVDTDRVVMKQGVYPRSWKK